MVLVQVASRNERVKSSAPSENVPQEQDEKQLAEWATWSALDPHGPPARFWWNVRFGRPSKTIQINPLRFA